MDFDAFQMRVEDARHRTPKWFALEGDPPASDTELQAAELSLKTELPGQYRQFAQEYGGGYFALSNVFSARTDSEWNIAEKNRMLRIPDFIAVSDNGCGDFYGFQTHDGRCSERIFVSEHGQPELVKPTPFEDLFDYLDVVALTST